MDKPTKKYLVTSTPHMREHTNISDIMRDVLIALAPATAMGIYFFGLGAVLTIVLSVASCVLFEMLYQKFTKQEVSISDLSAVVTGLLLAFNLPASAPFWLPIVGSFFAIIIVKQLFGGLGQNFMNPALAARAFLLTAYTPAMTNWVLPKGVDAVTNATPLGLLREGALNPQSADLFRAFIGQVGGCIGETSAAALLLGGVYLVVRKVISWRVPVFYIATTALVSWVLGRNGQMFSGFYWYEIFAGGLMLGAIFMATDYSSSPVTPTGKIIMGVGCGVLTAIIRAFGSNPEGVSYAILLMNLCVPLLDKFAVSKIYGEVKKHA